MFVIVVVAPYNEYVYDAGLVSAGLVMAELEQLYLQRTTYRETVAS